jgi:hypothetical protein
MDQLGIASSLCGAALSVAIDTLVRFIDPAESALQFLFSRQRQPFWFKSIEGQLFHRKRSLESTVDDLQRVVSSHLSFLGMLKEQGDKLSSGPPSWATIQLVLSSIQSIAKVELPTESATVESVDTLVAQLTTSLSALEAYMSDVEAKSNALIPPAFQKQWPMLVLAGMATIATTAVIVIHGRAVYSSALQASDSLRLFADEHIVHPLRNIFAELFLSQKTLIQDPAALKDAQDSLQRMLTDFMLDTRNDIAPEDRALVAQAMDMSVVSTQYESEIPKPLTNVLTGQVVPPSHA